MCPPIGCTMPLVKARCAGGACTAATATTPTVPEPPKTPSACDFWGGRGFKLEVSSHGGHGAQFRKFVYDDKARTLAIHDSDLFAGGTEAKTPRVIRKTLTLSQADADVLVAELTAICPSDAERAAQCAPGGCSTLELTTSSGAKAHAGLVARNGAFADSALVDRAMKRLSKAFPEARQYP
jgi:hypothetical protein